MRDMTPQINDLRDYIYPEAVQQPTLGGDFINGESARVAIEVDDDCTKLTTFGSWWSPDGLDELANLLKLTAESIRKNA